MAKRQTPEKDYSPLDDARGRFPIERDLVRDVVGEPTPSSTKPPAQIEQSSPPLSIVSTQSPPTGSTPSPSWDNRQQPTGADFPESVPRPIVLERLTKANKFLTTPREKLELDRLAARVSGALGVSVRPSHLIRACLIHLLHAENEIIRRAEKQQPVRRPSNTEAVAIAEFDHMIAEILRHAFREAGPLRARPPTREDGSF